MASNGPDLIDELNKLKTDIEAAKRVKAQAEGRLGAQLAQLLATHKCKTIEEAEAAQTKMEAKAKELTAELQHGVAKLHEEYEL